MEIAAFIGLGIVIGIILTFVTFLIKDKFFKPASVDGIYCPDMTSTEGGIKTSFGTQIEFHIQAKTQDLFKIKILHVTCDNSKFMDKSTINKIYALYDNTWIKRDSLHFVVDLDSRERLERINNIINS